MIGWLRNNLSILKRPVRYSYNNKSLVRYYTTKTNIFDVSPGILCKIISYIFQLVFSLSIIQKYFNLNHNDLHPGNILYRKTKIKFFYFYIDNEYYRIPTYNKIIKIIDWDRSTYNFNNYKVNNDIFKKHGEAYGQYIFKCLNNNK